MKLQQLLSYTRRAIDDYQMIRAQDKIAVGISGGKDSLTLLYALHALKRFYPEPFELAAITVDLGFPGTDYSAVQKLCDDFEVPYTIIHSDIAEILFEIRKEKNPCSLCAKLRKGAFNQAAKELGCNKIAYAHHSDDFVETSILSLIFESRFSCFSPVTYLDRMDLTLIRPLMYVKEMDIIGFRNLYKLPVVNNPCPADGYTQREYAKKLLSQINHDHPGAKDHIFSAILRGNLPGWPPKADSR